MPRQPLQGITYWSQGNRLPVPPFVCGDCMPVGAMQLDTGFSFTSEGSARTASQSGRQSLIDRLFAQAWRNAESVFECPPPDDDDCTVKVSCGQQAHYLEIGCMVSLVNNPPAIPTVEFNLYLLVERELKCMKPKDAPPSDEAIPKPPEPPRVPTPESTRMPDSVEQIPTSKEEPSTSVSGGIEGISWTPDSDLKIFTC